MGVHKPKESLHDSSLCGLRANEVVPRLRPPNIQIVDRRVAHHETTSRACRILAFKVTAIVGPMGRAIAFTPHHILKRKRDAVTLGNAP
jgi:hypothetical protein